MNKSNWEYDSKKLRKLLPSLTEEPEFIWKCRFCTFLNTNHAKNSKSNQCKICESVQEIIKSDIFLCEEEYKSADFGSPPEFALDSTECPQCGYKFLLNSKELCQCGINLSQLNAFISDLSIEKTEQLAEVDILGKLGLELIEINGIKGSRIKVRVWYPQARRIRFMGDFNKFGAEKGYDPKKYEMIKDKSGVFSLTLDSKPGFSFIGQRFKYYVEKANGAAEWRNDPRSLMFFGEKYVNDLIYDHSSFPWTDQNHCSPALNSLIIYEVHIAALANNNAESAFLKAIEKLDYLKELGINAIELMPITQDIHKKCWGYDPISLFAVHQTFGTADDLKFFINEAHNRNISVILDWVPNHICKMTILHEGYFYNPKDEKHGTRYGPRPDFSNPQVKSYLLCSLISWLRDFHFDGVRVDSLESMRFITDSQKRILEAWTFLQEMTAFVRKEFPEKILIAEDLQNDNKINGILGFDSQWDSAYFSVMLNAAKACEDSSRNSYEISKALKSRFEFSGFGRILYSENHDTIPDNRQMRLIKSINPNKEIPDIYAKRRSRLISAVSFVALGVPMLMAGQELMEMNGNTWPNPPPMPLFNHLEELSEEIKNSFQFFKDLISLRLNLEKVSQGLKGGNLEITHIHPSKELPIIALHRWDKGGPGDDVIIVLNFSNTSFKKKGYWINFPRGGVWIIRICSEGASYWFDEKQWGTKVQLNIKTELDEKRHDGYMFAGKLFLKKYSMLILSQD